MDEITNLKMRVLALEAEVRKQDKLLEAFCNCLNKAYGADPELLKATKEYLNRFIYD